MDTTALVELISNTATALQPALQCVVGAVMTTLFLRRNTGTTEFEKIKIGKFSEVTDDLLGSGKMTYYEYYKCKNFLDVAKLADKMGTEAPKRKQRQERFDFDWFMRFYDAVGNISNIDMQELWAKVLSGEINEAGSFSLRTLETLRNLNAGEAQLFQNITSLVITEKSRLKFIMCTLNDLGQDVNEAYGIGKNEFYILEECGLLNSVRNDNRISLSEKPRGFWNDKIYLELKYKRNDSAINSYKYSSYALTQSALQLLPVVAQESNADYLLNIGRELMKRYSGNLRVCAYNRTDIASEDYGYDDSFDLLSEERPPTPEVQS